MAKPRAVLAFKWTQPFLATFLLAYPPSPDTTIRVLMVASVLIYVAVMLSIVQPWQRDVPNG